MPLTVAGGCLVEIARYGVVAAIYLVALHIAFPQRATVVTGLVLAIFSTFLLNALWKVLIPDPDRRAVRQALTRDPGSMLPTGTRVAITGTLQQAGELLDSPLGDVPCIAYLYLIGRTEPNIDQGTIFITEYRGLASTPCELRSESTVPLQVYGIDQPIVEAFDEMPLEPKNARERARLWVTSTRFEPDPAEHPVKNAVKVTHAVLDQLRHPAKEMRWDYASNNRELRDDLEYREWVIRPGDTVTAIAEISRDRREFRGTTLEPLSIFPGNLAFVYERMRTDTHISWLMALAMFLIAHAMFAFAVVRGAFD